MTATPAWQLEHKNAKVATWMGWLAVGQRTVTDSGSTGISEKWMGLPDTKAMSVRAVPHYCTSWEDWHPVEERIDNEGLWDEWVAVLAEIAQISYDQSMRGFAFDVLHTTKEQRVDALLKVIDAS